MKNKTADIFLEDLKKMEVHGKIEIMDLETKIFKSWMMCLV